MLGESYAADAVVLTKFFQRLAANGLFPCCEVQHRWYVKVCAALCVSGRTFLKVEGNICLALTITLKQAGNVDEATVLQKKALRGFFFADDMLKMMD